MFKKTMVIQGHLCESLFILTNRLSHSLGHSNPLCVCAQILSHVWLFATPWTIAPQAPLSMGFSRQEYWSGLPFLHPGDLPEYITFALCISLIRLLQPKSHVGWLNKQRFTSRGSGGWKSQAQHSGPFVSCWFTSWLAVSHFLAGSSHGGKISDVPSD